MSDISKQDPAGTGSNQNLMSVLRDTAFNGNADDMALALGRPTEEVAGWLDGTIAVDEDGLMKARGIAEERGFCRPPASAE